MSARPAVSFVVILWSMAGCGGDAASPEGDALVRDSAGIRIVENPPSPPASCALSESPALDLGMVEGPPEYQFYRVFDAATLSDGRIAVVNQGSGEVRVFGADGQFDFALGGEGGGPGEFNRVFRVWVAAGDTLVVGDYGPWRFSYFTPAGEFVRAVIPTPRYLNSPRMFGVLSDGTYVLARDCCGETPPPGEWAEIELNVVRHGVDGEALDTLAILPYGRTGWLDFETRFAGRPVFETRSRAAAAGDRVIIGRADARELEIYELSGPPSSGTAAGARDLDMGIPSALLRWTGSDQTVTSDHLEAYRRAELERWGPDPDPQTRRWAEAMISDDRPVEERFPAHAAIKIGRTGEIWVQEFPRPGEGEAGWLVFAADGGLECRIHLPFENSWDLYEVGDDYVMGKIEDELGVERVQRYAFRRPAP